MPLNINWPIVVKIILKKELAQIILLETWATNISNSIFVPENQTIDFLFCF
jgi:hypothetical protein